MTPRVLVVDDSSYVRAVVARALEDDGVAVAGFARDGREAVDKNLDLEPDVVVMDLQMPRMNGVEALTRIRETRPVPVIVFASVTDLGAELAVRALAAGALDVVPKPGARDDATALAARVWAIATAHGTARPRRTSRARATVPRLVVVAASTGGPRCVEEFLAAMPRDFPAPVFIAQHMPAGFTASFARRLDGVSALNVFEGEDGTRASPGDACILPGGAVSTVAVPRGAGKDSLTFALRVREGPGLGGARPNASALFFSALGASEGRVAAVVLSGMGVDGSDAVPAIVAAGGRVIVQDREEAVIPSMPNAALAAGAQATERTASMPRVLARLTRADRVEEVP